MEISKSLLKKAACSCIVLFLLFGLFALSSSKSVKNPGKEAQETLTVQPFDIVIIDVDGKIEGQSFEGGHGEALMTLVGSGQMVPGFEAQLVGHRIGDIFEVTITFPTDYDVEELQGKKAVFTTTLHEIWRNIETDLGENYYSSLAEEWLRE